MATVSEPNKSELRYDILDTLKKDDLKILCSNRGIETGKPNKKTLIKLILNAKAIKIDYHKLTKQSLQLELKSKGIESSKSMLKTELIELCINNINKTETTNDLLKQLNTSELQTLCQNRKIKIENYNSTKSLCKLLETTTSDDLQYDESMTTKQLAAEMKGRNLLINGMKKKDMIKTLNSNITPQVQKLLLDLQEDESIENTKKALHEFIDDARKLKTKQPSTLSLKSFAKTLDEAHNAIIGLLRLY